MLILTRKIKETIMIGDNIRITLLAQKGCQISIGIDAPKDIPVHREEVYNLINKQKGQLHNER